MLESVLPSAENQPPAEQATRWWRSDIQGLRAIAVVGVVLFHLGIHSISGGFIGVDIFFVISGYLISQHLYGEIDRSIFSITRFYVRRARRILPAFVAIGCICLVAAYFIFFPPQFVSFAQSLIASSLFAANIYFFETDNYFAQSASSIPLLHIWSLGVEEQFYLFFPLLIVWVSRFCPEKRSFVIVLLGLASYALSIFLTHNHPAAAFYLIPFRACEFLIGSFLAQPSIKGPQTRQSANVAATCGAVFVVCSLFGFNSNLDFPGIVVALPCTGIALIIWGGTGQSSLVTRILSAAPLTFLGRISYSLYLAHWPVIVFGLQLFPNMTPDARRGLFILATVGLTLLMFYLVEEPFRRKVSWPWPRVLGVAASSIVAFVAVGYTIVSAQGFPARVTSKESYYLSFLKYDPRGPFRQGSCFLETNEHLQDFDVQKCLPAAEDGRPYVLLWGDSTAAHLYAGLRDPIEGKGYFLAQATTSSCPAALGYEVPQHPLCRPFNNLIASWLETHRKPSLVILASTWFYTPDMPPYVQGTLNSLRNMHIPVVIVGTPPFYNEPPPLILTKRIQGQNRSTMADMPLPDWVGASERLMGAMAAKNGIRYISIIKTYCQKGNCPLVTGNGTPIEFDTLHFTTAGSRFVGLQIAPLIMAQR